MEITGRAVVEWGVAAMTLPGESESGDRLLIKIDSALVFAAVVDGLGHGEEAAAAAQTAIQTLESASASSRQAKSSPSPTLTRALTIRTTTPIATSAA